MSAATKPILYSYWRSSCSWRVRIALHYKEIDFEQRNINLLSREQYKDEFIDKNPFGMVPVLMHGQMVLGESLAIIEYLEEKFPGHKTLLPGTAEDRAQIRALALQIIANTQPLQNLAVLEHLSSDSDVKKEWARHWIQTSFRKLEKVLAKTAGKYSYRNEPSLIDVCIPPQVYNAKRFGVEMSQFPTIGRLDATLAEIPAFRLGDCYHQPDTPEQERKID